MKKYKRTVVQAAVFLFIVLAACTVASRTVYNLLLPEVHSLLPSSGTLKNTRGYVGEICKEQGTAWLCFSIDGEEAERIINEASLKCSYIVDGEEVSDTPYVKRAEYDEEKNRYQVWASLGRNAENAAEGTTASVTATIKSKKYDILIPLECISRDERGNQYVMALMHRDDLWGTQFYVDKRIIVIEENDYQYAAVDDNSLASLKLAAYPSRILADGESVRVEE